MSYITDVQGLFVLMHIRGPLRLELVELLEIVDSSYKRDVDVKSFLQCFFMDSHKIVRLWFNAFVEGLGTVAKLTAQQIADQQRRCSYFIMLSFLLTINSLRRSEYMQFTTWILVQQYPDKDLDRIELPALIDKLVKLFSFDDKRIQSKLSKSFFQFQKTFDAEVDEIAAKTRSGSFHMEDLLSIELRCGQPFTSLMDYALRNFREHSLGISHWREISQSVRMAKDSLKMYYDALVEETHASDSHSEMQPHFDDCTFQTRKLTRQSLRLLIRYLQQFQAHCRTQEWEDEEDDIAAEGDELPVASTQPGFNRIRDDERTISEQVADALGLSKLTAKLSGALTTLHLTPEGLKARRERLRAQRAEWSVKDSAYIDQALKHSADEVLAHAQSLHDEVDMIKSMCIDALAR